tara:strand:+ start:246 stop:497 length:252 start_codon:yes stop_codon:yes gene_type:complete
MALTKSTTIGEMNVGEMGAISVRTDTVISEDNKELNRSFHRHVVSPGDDVSGEDARVKSVADALWTPEVIAAWKAAQPEETPA